MFTGSGVYSEFVNMVNYTFKHRTEIEREVSLVTQSVSWVGKTIDQVNGFPAPGKMVTTAMQIRTVLSARGADPDGDDTEMILKNRIMFRIRLSRNK